MPGKAYAHREEQDSSVISSYLVVLPGEWKQRFYTKEATKGANWINLH